MNSRNLQGIPMPIPTNIRLPFRSVLFEERDDTTRVHPDRVISPDEFLEMPNETINRAILNGRLNPLIVQLLGDEASNKSRKEFALRVPGDHFAIVRGFDSNPERVKLQVPFPMMSPRSRHVYLDLDQYEIARRFRIYNNALSQWINKDSPAGQRPVPPEDRYGKLMRAMERGRYQV